MFRLSNAYVLFQVIVHLIRIHEMIFIQENKTVRNLCQSMLPQIRSSLSICCAVIFQQLVLHDVRNMDN